MLLEHRDERPKIHESVYVAPTATICGDVTIGDPAEILAPDEHERVWALQESLIFPRTVFGIERAPAEVMMPEMTRRYARGLAKHREDRILDTR